MPVSLRALGVLIAALLVLALPQAASAQTAAPTGGAAFVSEPPPPPPPTTPGVWTGVEVPGTVAQLLPDGTAAAPADAPHEVKQAIWAANWLQDKPYRYGGGHVLDFQDTGYDCSGTVSFALNGAGLLETPLDSGSFMRWGRKGKGAWITVYTNPGHAYVVIAGLRLDTSAAGVSRVRGVARSATERGPRWRPVLRNPRGYVKRHPLGF